MEKFVIKGGGKLSGVTRVSGAKNVATKALVAACLTNEEILIKNIPLISDFKVMVDIVRELGGEVEITSHSAKVKMAEFKTTKISLERAAEIRPSAMFLSPLLALKGEAIIPNPGGCRIGARPIDRTIAGLEKMGAQIQYKSEDGYFYIKAPKGLSGVEYEFSKNTHTGTETLILAAVLARGKTVLDNAAQEPEVDDLIDLLSSMGARISKTGNRQITIEGVEKLHGAEFKISPDRNEIVTMAVAALITKGDVTVESARESQIKEFLTKLEEANGGYEQTRLGLRFYYKGELKATNITTSIYPGFMTDWQAPWAVLMTQALGESEIHETVYENRFGYVSELRKMGAKIEFFNPQISNPDGVYNFNTQDDNPENMHAVKITGSVSLHNAIVRIKDLRAGATLALAALAASGESVLLEVEHLDRGYEKLDEKLASLGADIRRISE